MEEEEEERHRNHEVFHQSSSSTTNNQKKNDNFKEMQVIPPEFTSRLSINEDLKSFLHQMFSTVRSEIKAVSDQIQELREQISYSNCVRVLQHPPRFQVNRSIH